MNAIARALRGFLAVKPAGFDTALVGGIAVSARSEPRFTRDVDFAVAVAGDEDAERYVFQLQQLGYEVKTTIEQNAAGRLSTVRLIQRGRKPLLDLLFATTGIEAEIVAASTPLEVVQGIVTNVAQVGHLIAMKLVARDDTYRPQDQLDLQALANVATATEWARAEAAIQLISERGYARGRDLSAALQKWRMWAST
jgi:Nucleotidyl transferase AbiEii toxin, Type IV TA system